METVGTGDLVSVETAGPRIDGIVFAVPSDARVVVAVIDRVRGPVMRTVERSAVHPREQAGDDDPALQRLIRRTPAASRGQAQGGGGGGQNRAGHTRAAAHRATGR